MPLRPGRRPSLAERRLATEHAAALALAECSTLAEAAPRILQAICELLGWDHGGLWTVDTGTNRLRCIDVWHGPSVSFPQFEAASRGIAFERGVGLPGRVWSSAEPAWIHDVVRDTNFPRAATAAREGLHAALGFPILLHGQVLGVLEFFSRDIREPDEGLLQLLTTIGSQIGLFVKRRRAEEELDRFFTLSSDLFCIAGFDGYFKRLNPTWTKVLGYTLDELTARPYFDFVHPDDRPATAEEARSIDQGGAPVLFENRYRCRDGSYRWLQWASTSYPGEQVVYAVARDITDRKATEAQLEASGRELQRNAQNLAQLVKELEVARHRAEEATRAKGEFLANMSHEIRTPLTAIVGMTDLALETRLTAEQRGYLETVKASSDALLTIVNEVLDFSKIEARHLELEKVDFDLRDTVEDAMQLTALRAEEKKLELACNIDPTVPDALIGDPGRLRQVIVNLVGNAIKFTERGEIVLTVTAEHIHDAGARLRFAVSDTGIGIPADKHGAIFEAFAQADSSTTRRYGGTGLGLAITSQLVQLMGGEIEVASEVGRGSTFHFTVDFDRSPGPERDRRLVEPVDLRGLRVLVVDDNATNRRIIAGMLTSWHLRPHAVESGAAGLAALAAAHRTDDAFRLVVLDGQMPEMDGFELARRIKRDRRFETIPMIMLTSMGRPGDSARLRRIGVSASLTKPAKHSDLLDAIVMLCGTRGADAATSAEVQGGEAVPAALMRPRGSRQTGGGREPASPALLRKLRVLLAEDNVVNRRLVQSILRKRGHDLVAVEDGRAAVHAVTRGARPFDLVLMDVQMPEMGGLEATAAIREHERTSGLHVPIVAMTARALSGDREECLRAGMDGYLSKPVRAEQLIEAVERYGGAPAHGRHTGSRSSGGSAVNGGGLDQHAALARVNGDRRLLREVAELFLADCPRTLAALRRAVRQKNAARIHAAAHALKGSVAIFGARAAVEAARELQRMGETGELAGAQTALEALESRLESARTEIATLARRPSTARRTARRPGTTRGTPGTRKPTAKKTPAKKPTQKKKR
jgi:two-component system, sensor histidine kinase and response regulator